MDVYENEMPDRLVSLNDNEELTGLTDIVSYSGVIVNKDTVADYNTLNISAELANS